MRPRASGGSGRNRPVGPRGRCDPAGSTACWELGEDSPVWGEGQQDKETCRFEVGCPGANDGRLLGRKEGRGTGWENTARTRGSATPAPRSAGVLFQVLAHGSVTDTAQEVKSTFSDKVVQKESPSQAQFYVTQNPHPPLKMKGSVPGDDSPRGSQAHCEAARATGPRTH